MTDEDENYKLAIRALNVAAYKALSTAKPAGQQSSELLELVLKTDELVDGLPS